MRPAAGERSISTEIEIKAPPERVFDAWVTPSEVVAWWGEEGMYRVTRWEGDIRTGGRWRSEGVSADGSTFLVEGMYLLVDRPNALSFTWKHDWGDEPETTVELRFLPTSDGTLLKLRHSGFSTDASRDNHANGWPRVFRWLQGHFTVQRNEKTP